MVFADEVERSLRVLSGASGGSCGSGRDAHPDRAVAGEIVAVARAEVRPRGIHRACARDLSAAHGGPPKSRPPATPPVPAHAEDPNLRKNPDKSVSMCPAPVE
ncbi:hypothetical protein GCM10027073_27750 [Streptomyces chlorus]